MKRSVTFNWSVAGLPPLSSQPLSLNPLRLDDEHVAFPPPDGVAEPRGIHVRGKGAAIGEDLAIRVHRFVEDDHHSRNFEDLEGVADQVRSRHSADDAVGGRVVLAAVGAAFLEQRLGPRLEGHLARFEIPRDIADHARRRPPEASQHRLSAAMFRHRRGQVRLAVGQAGDTRGRMREPLRGNRSGHHHRRQCCREQDPLGTHRRPPICRVHPVSWARGRRTDYRRSGSLVNHLWTRGAEDRVRQT